MTLSGLLVFNAVLLMACLVRWGMLGLLHFVWVAIVADAVLIAFLLLVDYLLERMTR